MVRITQIVAAATLFVGLSGAQNTGHLSVRDVSELPWAGDAVVLFMR